jgi:hypothetical protein
MTHFGISVATYLMREMERRYFQLFRRAAVSNIFKHCPIFIQFLVIFGLGFSVQADELVTQYVWSQPKKVSSKTLKKRGRGPASAVPADDYQPVPLESKVWLSNVFVEDRHGVMNSMKDQVNQWERVEEYRRNWDIGSTGLYHTPDRGQKKAWFSRMILRYADKRLSGEMKNAAEGSTLARVSNVRQALRPNTTASISKNFKLKFKARILQMRGIVRLINPWVESETEINARGEVNSRVAKNFEELGVRADIHYQVSEGTYQASISKPLGSNVTAIVTSAQTDSEVAFSNMDNNTFQLVYSTPF